MQLRQRRQRPRQQQRRRQGWAPEVMTVHVVRPLQGFGLALTRATWKMRRAWR